MMYIFILAFLFILNLVISITFICQVKLRTRTSENIKGTKICAPRTKLEKQQQKDDIEKDNVPVAPNKTYAIHNVSRGIQVLQMKHML